MAIDLDRVKSYIELGFEKEDAIKRVTKEMKEDASNADIDIVDTPSAPEVDLTGYVKKEDVDAMIEDAVTKAVEKANLDKATATPPEDKPTLGDLMNRFF